MSELTAKRSRAAKLPAAPGLRLTGAGIADARHQQFAAHWRQICGDTQEMRTGSAAAHSHRAELAATSYSDLPEVTLQRSASVHILNKLPKGKAGGQDGIGIVAEFLQPLPTGRGAALHSAVEGRLQGREAPPPPPPRVGKRLR